MKTIEECDHSAFISYATADDAFGWVRETVNILNRAVGAKTNLKSWKPMLFTGTEPIVQGRLSDELAKKMAASFALIIFVGDGYLGSSWCLQELQYFKDLFGVEGVRNRLYIIAMSENAIRSAQLNRALSNLGIEPGQAWMHFYHPDSPSRPLPTYCANIDGSSFISPQFRNIAMPLVENLASKLTDSARKYAPASTYSPPEPNEACRKVVFAATTAELDSEIANLCSKLAATGVQIEVMNRDSLVSENFDALDDAHCLILPFSDAQPLLPSRAGGHLTFLRDIWLSKNKAGDKLVWLNMCHVSAKTKAGADHAQILESLTKSALLMKELGPWIEKTVYAAGERIPPSLNAVHIYIESNQNERLLWRSLGLKIQRRWEKVCAHQGRVPPLALIARGLPVDESDRVLLSDADGVILLWGKKEVEALIPQINKVENRLPEHDLPPSFVAYIMPPQPYRSLPIPSHLWQVLRFQSEVENDIDVIDDDTAELDGILQEIFERTIKRPQLPHSAGMRGLP